MPVGAYAEEDEVEDGETGGVFAGEFADELLLVRVCDLLERILRIVCGGGFDKGGVDGVDVFLGNGDFRPKLGRVECVVGILVVEGDDALVCVEYLPRRRRSR